MQMSPSIGKLAAALAKAQKAMKPAQKDRDNPFFKSSYATLASVFDAIREPFGANGLALIQPPGKTDEHGNVVIETIIMHESGEWISGEASAKPVKNDPQGVGSVMSYLRRYGAQSMAGLASADDDDDGNAASRPQPPAQRQEPTKAAAMQVVKAEKYDNMNPEAQKALAGVLKKKKVDEAFHEEIGKRLHLRSKTELDNVIAEVITAGAFGS